MNKILQELNLEDDFLFAKVMSDKEICKEFLEKLLDIEIKKIEMPENQKTIDLLLDCKGIRLDIYVKDENNTVYNIEMQRSDNKNLGKRMRYYQGNIDIDCIQKGQDYRELTKSYIIFICTFDYFKEGYHKYTFENVCLENNNVRLEDDTHKIILNTKGYLKDLNDDLLEFLNYVEDSSDEAAEKAKSDLVKHIRKKVNAIKRDKSTEVEFMTLLERDREKIEEGFEKGIKRGIEKGTEKGIELTKKVFKLNSAGYKVEEISEKCNIPVSKVKEILE